ncbi:MAG TPA: MFS transporter [Hyphomicrobiaceae bacterium]|nr:MFS transporter [Hyphomicrobiaceae bacterium]
MNHSFGTAADVDSAYAWLRLVVAALIGTIGNVGMWSVVVVLPAVQAEFGIDRAAASFPYTMTLIGFGFGGILAGRIADRHGVMFPVMYGAIALGLGYVATGYTQNLWQFALAHGLLIGFFGTATMFAPLLADITHWFNKRRGIALAVCASGNYLSGAIWPPILQASIDAYGWRFTHLVLGIFCTVTLLLLAPLLQRRAPHQAPAAATLTAQEPSPALLRLRPLTLQILLIAAGLACCVAMSMPQVHIVAYCADLGFGAQRGAEMLSLMLAFGVVSRIISGFISDKIGGLYTLLLGSTLQGIALLLYLPFDGLASLYVVSALFGFFQGGIVPSYALIVREYFSPKEAGTRVGIVLMATLFGMALGGWLSGVIYDLTDSYQAAFLNGIAWNLLNISIVLFLLWRRRIGRRRRLHSTVIPRGGRLARV